MVEATQFLNEAGVRRQYSNIVHCPIQYSTHLHDQGWGIRMWNVCVCVCARMIAVKGSESAMVLLSLVKVQGSQYLFKNNVAGNYISLT